MESPLIPAIFCALVLALCNIGTKKSLDPNYEWIMYPVYAGLIFSFWIFRRVCQSYGLAVASGIVDSIITIASVMAGLIFFSEVLILRQYVGLALLITGLYLVR